MGLHIFDLLIALLTAFVAIYGMGSAARQHTKVDEVLTLIECGYGSFNNRLKRASIHEGLKSLKKVYGWATVIVVVAFFILGRSVEANKALGSVLSVAFVATFLGWFSIQWSTEHKKELAKSAPLVLAALGPLVIGAIDFVSGTSWINTSAEPFYTLMAGIGLNVPHVNNPAVLGGIISAIFAVSFAIFYLLTWLIVAPIAFASVALIALPIWFAKVVDLIAPKKAFPGFIMIVTVALALWEWASHL
ncbi:hypothetical protein [Microvirga sp. 2TAF3]|uniref:hypothetical protein n=1 Tax=Microvirga sp. 2TAF3 TaxID=3233014 RepID=UPI003F9577A5